jgi:hypothetical protein
VKAKVVNYHRQHKILTVGSGNKQKPFKVNLAKETFFDLSIIPKNSHIWQYIKVPGSSSGSYLDTINFKELTQNVTENKIK